MKKIKCFLFITLSFFTSTISAQDFNEVIKAVASDRDTADQFGISISISGDRAIVGAASEDEDAMGGNTLSNAGSAYIFERDGSGNWIEVQKLVAAERNFGDNFGGSVSISGDQAIIGAKYEDEDAMGGNTLNSAGSAYIFERDGAGNWIEVQKLVAADRGPDDLFGGSVSISGDLAIIGASYETEDAMGGNTLPGAGSAYIFERDGAGNWNEVQKLVAADRGPNDLFGRSVSISGDLAIIGVMFEDEDAMAGNTLSNAGSVYIFERDGAGVWFEVQKLVAADRGTDDRFGKSVSISGDRAIIGAMFEDEDAMGGNTLLNAGSAYIFERDGAGVWFEVQKLVAADRDGIDQFGFSVSISGDSTIIGAFNEDEDAMGGNTLFGAGAAYIFERDGAGNWNEVQKLVASDRDSFDQFGYSVSISGDSTLIGASSEDEDEMGGNTLFGAGSAYFFETAPPHNVIVSSGDLIFTDNNDRDDNLTIVINGANYRITDPSNSLIAGMGATQIDANTVDVTITSVTGDITINTNGGDDSLTTDFSGGNFQDIINYDGGAQNNTNPGDILTLQGGGTFATVEHTFTNASDGGVAVSGNGAINYVGLEPVIDNLMVADRIFTFTGADESIFLVNEATTGSNIIDSTLGESVTFTNPTNSLTINTDINGGSGTDNIGIGDIDAAFNADLIVNSGLEMDQVSFSGSIDIGTGSYFINAYRILAVGALSTSGTGEINLTALSHITKSSPNNLTSENGDINLSSNASGISTDTAYNAIVITQGEIETTGTGNINITGIEVLNGTDSFNYGVVIANGGSVQATGTGSIFINGTGGDGTDNNDGVNIQNSATVRTVNGDITVIGISGTGTTNDNNGIKIVGATVESTGTGVISMNGTSLGVLENNNGVLINGAGTSINAAGGNINITGQGAIGAMGDLNSGIQVSDGATIENIGTGAINLTGIGGDGNNSNNGVTINGAGTAITTVNGGITCNGTSGVGALAYNDGIRVETGAVVESTGMGLITMDGISTESQQRGNGISITNAGSEVRTNGGGISLTGQGALISIGQRNYGVAVSDDALVSDSSSGDITINGTGGNGSQLNYGVYSLFDGTLQVTNGNLLLNGTSGSTSTTNNSYAIGVVNSKAEAIGTGSITINGQASGGVNSGLGVLIIGDTSIGATTEIVTAGGGINITGQGAGTGNDCYGMYLLDASIFDTAGGDITINGTGASGANNNSIGFAISDDSSVSTTGGGNINITGTAGNALSSGIYFENTDVQILSSGTTTLTTAIGPLVTPAGIPAASLIEGTTVTLIGELQPGKTTPGLGQLPITGNTVLADSAILSITISGEITPGTDYDQLAVNGTVDISDATLNLIDDIAVPITTAAEIILIDNDGADAVIGNFNGLPNGAAILFNNQSFIINYDRGDGNDVTLTVGALPTAVCQDIIVQLDAAGSVTILPIDVDNGSSDPDGPVTLSIDIDTFTCTDIGPNMVTLTVTDNTGSTASCTAIVTVEDMIAPIAVCQNITVQLDEFGQATIIADDVDGGSTDNCGNITTTIDITTFDCSNLGDNIVTLTVTDDAGLSSTCTAIVTVIDILPPTITCPESVEAFTDSDQCTATNVALGSPDVFDNCDVMSITNDAPAVYPIGITVVTWTVTDTSGNINTCLQEVSITDNELPTAVCENFTIQLDATGIASISPDELDGGSTDNCTIASIYTSQDTFTCDDLGDNLVTLFVEDASGNVQECTAIITVQDIIPPTLVCMNISEELDVNGMVVLDYTQLIDPASTDNCGIVDGSLSISEFNCTNIGDNTVTLTVVDASGNEATCTAIITIIDNSVPVASCQNITITLDDMGMATITPEQIDAGSYNNCGNVTLSIDMDTFDCTNIGDNIVILTVTNDNGAIATCEATVTITEETLPEAVCQNITVSLDPDGNVTILASDIDGGSTDSCGAVTLTIDQDSFDCTHVGENDVVLTVTDTNGNSSSCTAVVTIEDVTPPTAICQNITIELDENGMAAITALDIDGGSTDPCGIATTEIDIDTFDCSNLGDNNVTLTVTDINGNQSNCIAIVTV
ncbi:HYR domain-containing protein, partial [Patiriisocius marinus]|uniref:HYR domain-containing protein n=1 Tax=Patiriisocius marinus TaxID=1397112 RepID=UPI00232BB9FB